VLEDPTALQALLRDQLAAIVAKPTPPPAPPPKPAAAPAAAPAAVDVSEAPAAAPAPPPLPPLPTIDADAPDPKLVAVLEEAGCGHLAPKVHGVPIEAWWREMEASRPAFLKRLQTDLGVEKLAERQAVANKLGKAKREAAK
jgi:hypothetical protein